MYTQSFADASLAAPQSMSAVSGITAPRSQKVRIAPPMSNVAAALVSFTPASLPTFTPLRLAPVEQYVYHFYFLKKSALLHPCEYFDNNNPHHN